MEAVTKKILSLFALTLITFSASYSLASEGGNGSDRGGGIVVPDPNGTITLFELADTIHCRWVSGADLAKKTEGWDALQKRLTTLDPLFGEMLETEMNGLNFCLTKQTLRLLPEAEQEVITRYSFGSQQIAIRIRAEVYINEHLLRLLPKKQKPYLLLHEALHGFVSFEDKERMKKIRFFVKTIFNSTQNSLTPEKFKELIQTCFSELYDLVKKVKNEEQVDSYVKALKISELENLSLVMKEQWYLIRAIWNNREKLIAAAATGCSYRDVHFIMTFTQPDFMKKYEAPGAYKLAKESKNCESSSEQKNEHEKIVQYLYSLVTENSPRSLPCYYSDLVKFKSNYQVVIWEPEMEFWAKDHLSCSFSVTQWFNQSGDGHTFSVNSCVWEEYIIKTDYAQLLNISGAERSGIRVKTKAVVEGDDFNATFVILPPECKNATAL